MALPLVRILKTMAPVVVSAFDLYRQRREARERSQTSVREATSPEALGKRIQDLESADVDQARLISELSNTVEALATALENEMAEGKRRALKSQRLVWTALGLSAASTGAVIWLAAT